MRDNVIWRTQTSRESPEACLVLAALSDFSVLSMFFAGHLLIRIRNHHASSLVVTGLMNY